jgi:transcription elongation factor Elf1
LVICHARSAVSVFKQESTVGVSIFTSTSLIFGNTQLHIDLSAPVDVYSDWVDACDTVAKSTANQDEDDEPKTGPSQASAIAIQPAGVESYAHQADDDNY